MAEHPVPDVMYQGCCKCDPCLVLTILPCAVNLDLPLDYPHKLPRRVEYANAVGKSGVSCSRKHKFTEAELSYPTEPLEWVCLDNPPERLLELVGAEFY
jgi:hypothetical protein